jgi:protein gp37
VKGSVIYGYATKSWHPVLGCREDLKCAQRCWAKSTVHRLAHSPNEAVRKAHAGLVTTDWGEPPRSPNVLEDRSVCTLRWTGAVRLNEAHLLDPLKWRAPQIVATGYHGDVGSLAHNDIAQIFRVMAWCRQHQYLILSKHIEGLVRYCEGMARLTPERRAQALIADADGTEVPIENCSPLEWPLPWVWIGVSAEDQPSADERLLHLMKLAAGWKTWVSLEPMVAEVDLHRSWLLWKQQQGGSYTSDFRPHLGVAWVVVGAESGPNARELSDDAIRSVVKQCREFRVPVYVKQRCQRGKPIPFAEWPEDLKVRQTPWEVRA